MHANKILKAIMNQAEMSSRVRLTFVDRTNGETAENYFAAGNRADFSSIYDFTADALLAIDRYMHGESAMEITALSWANLQADSCEPESWMGNHYDSTIHPGDFLCFPSTTILGFSPPPKLERKLWLLPDFSDTEECVVCANSDSYVLLYWHTTG